jgi:predicted GIY-YIG superfamily endonuclease
MEKQETLDIVAFVKDHPLTRLSNHDYGSEIIEKIKKKFNSYEQQLFVTNFYCYLNYDTRKDFVIELNKVYHWIGFSRKSDCKSLLVNNFIENEDYKIENNFAADAAKLEARGRPEENVLLTIRCFKKLCLKAKTKKSDEIHEYYIQLEEVMNDTVAEQAEKLKNQLAIKDQQLTAKDQQLTAKDQQLTAKDQQREQMLILNFRGKHVVYLIIIEGKIIKFGYTKDIEKRMKKHRVEFGENIVLHSVFETIYNREFEIMIKKDPAIVPHIINKTYKTNQTELIQLSETFTLQNLEKYMETLKENINGDLIQNLMKENQKLKLKLAAYESNTIRSREIELAEKEYELRKEHFGYIMDTTPKTPRKDQYVYQVYDSKNLKLLKTYRSIEDVVQERKLFRDAIKQSIGRAVMKNQIYKGYRFWRINQDDEDKEYTIPPTNEVDRTIKYDQVVKINNDCTEVVGIYSCVEEAAKQTAKINATEDDIRRLRKSITNNLSEEGLSYNYRWYRLSDAPEELVDIYLETHELPDVQINKNQKKVYKYDQNRNLVCEYLSMTEASKKEKISDVSLKKYITKNILFNNHYFSN